MSTQKLSKSKKNLIRLTAFFSASALLGKIVSIPHSIVIAKYLGPSMLGIFALIKLIIQYSSHTQMGILQSMAREIPMAYGSGKKEQVEIIRNTVFTSYSIIVFFSLIVLWGVFAFGITFGGVLNLTRLVLLTGVILFQRAGTFLRIHIKAEGKFDIIAKFELYDRFVTPISAMIFVVFLKLEGAILALMLTNIFTFCYYYFSLGMPTFRVRLDVKKSFVLIKTGFLIFINKISDGLFWNTNVFIIAALLTNTDVGYYSIALTMLLSIGIFVRALNMVTYRKIMVDGGKFGIKSREHFKKYLGTSYIFYIMINCMAIGLAILAYQTAITTILVEYQQSLNIMVILGMGYMLYNCRIFLSHYLNVTNQMVIRLGIIAIGFCLNASLDYYMIKAGYGIQGVAFACALSFIYISFSFIIMSFKQIYGKVQPALFFILKITIITALFAGLLFAFKNWAFIEYKQINDIYLKLLWAVLDLGIKVVIYSAVCFLSFILFFKKYKIYSELQPIWGFIKSSVLSFRFRRKIKFAPSRAN